ncbi:hypothetical protein HMPREF1982_03386 [Clostridiales bacterium oral taxon 876 str. F0540]|nr:hypothetical protein HMPREF1982_03386 [Clostridiales bacterium oral taxon 876 str. F0540]
MFAADMNELKESLKKIVKLNPKKVYNSHGLPADVNAIEKLIVSCK